MARKHVRRRDFIDIAARVLTGSVVVSFMRCETRLPAGPAGSENLYGEISLNHGHEALITGVQLAAGGAIVLRIRGRASHDHTVELSATQVATLSAGGRVSVESSADYEDKHGHTVSFR